MKGVSSLRVFKESTVKSGLELMNCSLKWQIQCLKHALQRAHAATREKTTNLLGKCFHVSPESHDKMMELLLFIRSKDCWREAVLDVVRKPEMHLLPPGGRERKCVSEEP